MKVRQIIAKMVFSYNNIIWLVKMGKDLNKRLYKDNTMLMICSRYNMKKEAGLLIKSGANLDLQDSGGKTALHIAIRFGSCDIAEMLIKNGANLDLSDVLGRTPIHYATMSNDRPIVELLAQYGANVNKSDIFGETALFKAISYKKDDVTDFLIDNSGSLDIADKFGSTPLHLAVMLKDEKILNRLLDKNVDMNKTNIVGQTPLAFAVRKGYTKIASILIQNNADLNVIGRHVRPYIIDEACMKGYVDMVDMLMDNGADITRYVVNWAVSRGEDDIINKINILDENQEVRISANEEEVVQKMLKRGQSLAELKRSAVYNNKTKRLTEVLKLANQCDAKLENKKLIYKAVKNNNEKMANALLSNITRDSVGALEYLLNDKKLNELLNREINSDTRERIKNSKLDAERDCILNCIYASQRANIKGLEK